MLRATRGRERVEEESRQPEKEETVPRTTSVHPMCSGLRAGKRPRKESRELCFFLSGRWFIAGCPGEESCWGERGVAGEGSRGWPPGRADMFQWAVLRSEATLGHSEATFAAELIAVHTFFFCATSDARTISPIGLTASENGPIFRLSLVCSCSVITTLVLSFCSCSRFSLLSGVIFPALLKFLCLCRCCGFAALLSATRFFQSRAVQI